VNVLQAIDDPKVFGQHFRAGSWQAWRVFLATMFALPLTDAELAIYRQCTGRDAPPSAPLHESWLVCGRRAGKSFILATIAVFLACFFDWRPYLGPGEIATIMIIARDRRQARVIKRFITGLLQAVPMLRRVVEDETQETITLKNRVSIEIHTASFRSTRGYTIVAALLDEIAYWPSEDAAEPDVEVINAIKPGMATIPGAMLLCASSPYARRGALWEAHRRHFAKDNDPVLVWQAPTRTMNSTVPQSLIDEAMEADPASAAAEYLAEFRTDVETFVLREVVEAAVVSGRFELPRVEHTRYFGFVDPSGGSSDSMTLAVAHVQADDRVIIDAIRDRRPPFSPDEVVNEFATLLKSYGVGRVKGDRYGGEWPREVFRKHGVEYSVADKAKSDLYRDLLPLLNSGRVELLDLPRLVAQLCSLERRIARGGRDSIDHPPGAHDDVANCVAGVAITAVQAPAVPEVPIVGPLLFNLRTGEIIPAASQANCPPPPGFNRRSCDEPWWPYVSASGVRRDRWSPDW
jgi:hypothetical protein